ncbi:folylpolyglutamate synthase isoform X1 [Elaeis guineensis]|uniref:Folylpolyglutamate synthase n=2 Tax=Elaeis guineensis var. tenera TaxID=51953 RepID=A0A6I9S7V3_ELAGV|nr:folylpolyglutamate synthase isoform X1 [Elaeis guineensis]XP_019710187.1 folylpolyglutamate synthase isoform X1 [Elaeis guineensis]
MASNGVVHGHSQELALSSSYETAMEALSSLISRRKRGDGSKRGDKFDMMFRYLKILDLEECIAGLKIIHVAGTKGKGSTCTFSEAILRECGFRTGLFTSPHLMDVRERYRINGSDISRENFLHYFWDCWNQLKAKAGDDLPMPPLFHFLTLLAFKIFLSEKVDVGIIEVGLGGRFDSTNVIKESVVCGITSLGMDHMEILGDTIEKIASEKAGIFKPNVPAFTAPQLPEAMFALQERASTLKIPLRVASPLDSKMLNGLKLGLAGDHQFINAGLAVALCKCWLQRTGHPEILSNEDLEAALPEAFLRGLSGASLPGRAQIIIDKPEKSDLKSEWNRNSGDLIFFLDGAHSPESMEVCARWFSKAIRDDLHSIKNNLVKEFHGQYNSQHDNRHCNGSDKISQKILLFNCMEMRDPQLLLPRLINTCASSGVYFSKALFVPSLSTYHRVDSGASIGTSDPSTDVSWQSTLQRTWEKLMDGKDVTTGDACKFQNFENSSSSEFLNGDPLEKCDPRGRHFAHSAVIPSLPLAVTWLRDHAKENPSLRLQVLVTGSLHLVGDIMKLLRR